MSDDDYTRPRLHRETDHIHAPWTRSEVRALNTYQRSGIFHEFTCGALVRVLPGDRQLFDGAVTVANVVAESCGAALVATADGWCCPRCGQWKQTWAHRFMAEAPSCSCPEGTDCAYPCRRAMWDAAGRALAIEAAQ